MRASYIWIHPDKLTGWTEVNSNRLAYKPTSSVIESVARVPRRLIIEVASFWRCVELKEIALCVKEVKAPACSSTIHGRDMVDSYPPLSHLL
jgi:hypothetical protein